MSEGNICPFMSRPEVDNRYRGLKSPTDQIWLIKIRCIRDECKAWEWDDEHVKEGHCKIIDRG
jgi:hypothetical protein